MSYRVSLTVLTFPFSENIRPNGFLVPPPWGFICPTPGQGFSGLHGSGTLSPFGISDRKFRKQVTWAKRRDVAKVVVNKILWKIKELSIIMLLCLRMPKYMLIE